MADEQSALKFADKLYASATNVAGASNVQIDSKWKRDAGHGHHDPVSPRCAAR
jgi:hypothetical protein